MDMVVHWTGFGKACAGVSELHRFGCRALVLVGVPQSWRGGGLNPCANAMPCTCAPAGLVTCA
jgi:hypothetical protein